MPEITITENGVEKLLQNLNPNKACGPDELAPRLLKELAHDLTPFGLSFVLSTGAMMSDM
jgi:hypothetical protein